MQQIADKITYLKFNSLNARLLYDVHTIILRAHAGLSSDVLSKLQDSCKFGRDSRVNLMSCPMVCDILPAAMQ